MLVSNNLENSVIVGGASKVGLAGGPNKCASVRQAAAAVVQLNASNSNTLSNNTHSNSNSNSLNTSNNNTCFAHPFSSSSDPTTSAFTPRQNFYHASVISSPQILQHQQQQQVIKYTDDLTNPNVRGTKRPCEIEASLDVAITKRAVGASQLNSLAGAPAQQSLPITGCAQSSYLPLRCGVKLETSCLAYQQHSIHQRPGTSEELQQKDASASVGQDEDSDEDSSLDYESVFTKILNEKKLALCNSPDVLKLLNSFSQQQQPQQ